MNLEEALKMQGRPDETDRSMIPEGQPGACKMCRILAELGDDARATMRHYVEDLGFGQPRITAALLSMGYPVGSATVARHLSQRHDRTS